jgi:dimethylargininase
LNIEVHILPADGYADSVFIEDTLLSIDHNLMLTRPGASSRKKEVDRVRTFLHETPVFKQEYEIYAMKSGQLDGGDVLFTGLSLSITTYA